MVSPGGAFAQLPWERELPPGLAPPQFLIAPFDSQQLTEAIRDTAAYEALPVTFIGHHEIEMQWIPPGRFLSGSPATEVGRDARESQSSVQLTDSYYLGVAEVTRRQYFSIMGDWPAALPIDIQIEDNFPITHVTWKEVMAVVRRLNELEKENAGEGIYRLPSNGEWEFACRAGTVEAYWFGDVLDPSKENLGSQAMSQVKSFSPNPLGLFDMQGNVREWGADMARHVHGLQAEMYRTVRGGCWQSWAFDSRSAALNYWGIGEFTDDVGFRLAYSPRAVSNAASVQRAKNRQQLWADFLGWPIEKQTADGFAVALMPPGRFVMGRSQRRTSHSYVSDRDTFVRLTQPVYFGKFEVTQQQFLKVMGRNPSDFSEEVVQGTEAQGLPVERVSWNDVQEFLDLLNQNSQEPGWRYRLPTEAEWEYACLAGTGQQEEPVSDTIDETRLALVGNTALNRTKRPLEVGRLAANAWGLHDMQGNVWEWCQDWHSPLDGAECTDPTGPVEGKYRIARGGSWRDPARFSSPSNREFFLPDHNDRNLGFRIVIEPTPSP